MIKKLYKYEDGGKPKKRVIFAETPSEQHSYYNSKVEGVDVGSFDNELFRTGRNKLAEELYKIKEQYNLPGKKYSDGDEFVDEIFNVVNSTSDFKAVLSYIKDVHKVDLSNNEDLKKAFAESTGFPNIVKYGVDNFETVYEDLVDDTFLVEAEKIAKASKEIDGVPIEIVPIYGKEDFEKVVKKYDKDSLKGADVILLGHAGTKIAGVDNNIWNSYLRDNMDSKNTCYGGICNGDNMAVDFKDVPNFTGTVERSWLGMPGYKNYKGKGTFEDLFFSVEESEESDDYDWEGSATTKIVKPVYGKNFANFRKNPELLDSNFDNLGRLVRSSNLAELPFQIEPIPTLPTLRTNVTQKDGGKLNFIFNNIKMPIAQDGVKGKLTKSESDLYDKYKAYVSSDTYRSRLQNFRTPEQAQEEQYTSLDRLRRAKPPVISPINLPKQIQGWYEMPAMLDGIGSIMLSPKRSKYAFTHEMDHLNRAGGNRYNNSELALLKLMNREDSNIPKGQLDYLQDPTESGARLSNIRAGAVEYGIHKDFGEEFTKEQLQELIEKTKGEKVFEFIQAYNPEELLQALNTIADSGEQQEINISRNGGEIQELLMKNTKFPIAGSKFNLQQGGYGELQGDAGKLLLEIMKGTTMSGMFNPIQGQDQFNRFLPITQNMAGLFDLQQRERSELENKKLRVQDFPTSSSSYAPAGFFQGGGKPSQAPSWIKDILNYESTAGSVSGTGLRNYGIKRDKWGKKYKYLDKDTISEEDAIQFIVDEFLPMVKEYPEEVQKRLVDYAYNTGRNIEDVILYAAGLTDLNSVQTKNTDFETFNKNKAEIIKNMSDPEFISKLDQAKHDILKDFWARQGKEDVYEKTSKNRIDMWSKNSKNNNPSKSTSINSIVNEPPLTGKDILRAHIDKQKKISENSSINTGASSEETIKIMPLTGKAALRAHIDRQKQISEESKNNNAPQIVIPIQSQKAEEPVATIGNIKIGSTVSTNPNNITIPIVSNNNNNTEPEEDKITSKLRYLVRGGTDAVANYQEMLQSEGLYEGNIDGAWGPKTQKAYEQFLDRTRNINPIDTLQDGGGIKLDETNSPSLQAIMKGLPKGMSKKHKEMVVQSAKKEILNKLLGAVEVQVPEQGIPQAGLGDFFSKVGKGIKSAVKGVGNVAHDWGTGIADSFGNSTGLYDIDNSKYKTGLGRSISGFNDQLQSTTGQIGRAIGSAVVPGLSNIYGGGNTQNQTAQTQQQVQEPRSYSDLEILMGMMPSFMGALQSPTQDNYSGFFKEGGGPQQKLGYKRNSPYKNLPFQNFTTDTITMDDVDKKLLAIADTGEVKVLKPNSGLHRFLGATNITEVPMAQDGGEIEDNEEMIEGIIDMLRQIDDLENRKEVAQNQLQQIKKEGIEIDEDAFLEAVFEEEEIDMEDVDEDSVEVEDMKEGGQPKGTNGQVKKSWRAGKKLAVYMDGSWHHFGDSSMQDFRQHKSEKRKKAWYARHAKALKGDDPRSKAFRVFARKAWEDGGQPKINIMNPVEKLIKQYRQGGSVFDKDLIANEESKTKSYINLPLLIPIQTEVKETIVLPDGSLTKVNAKKRHSKMTDNEVTDIVPESSYVLSQFGDTKIYKEEAKQVVLEMKAEPYNIHRASGVPQAKSLGDIMKHNVMSPADLSRVVNNKFKVVEGDDPFLNQTNEQNKFNRTAYLQAIIGLSEYDKARKGIDNSISTQIGAQMVAKHGGKVMTNYKVPKAVDPVSAVIAAIPQLANIGFNVADRITAKKNRKLNDADIDAYGNTARRNLGFSTLSNSLGVILQNPEVTPAIYDTSYLDAMNSNNMAYLNNISRRAATDAFNNRLDTSSMNPQMAMLLGERDNAMRYEALGKTAAELAKTRGNLFAKYMQMKQATADKNVDSRVSSKNLTQAALNSQVGTLGGIFAGAADTSTNIEANLLNSRMANRGNYAANISQLNSSLGQSLQNAANVGLQMYTSDQAAKNAEAQNRNSRTIKYQAECQRQGFNWICAPDGICYCDN